MVELSNRQEDNSPCDCDSASAGGDRGSRAIVSADDKSVLAALMTFHCRGRNTNKAMCKIVMSDVPAAGNTLWFSA